MLKQSKDALLGLTKGEMLTVINNLSMRPDAFFIEIYTEKCLTSTEMKFCEIRILKYLTHLKILMYCLSEGRNLVSGRSPDYF